MLFRSPQYRALVPNTTPTWTWLYVGVRNLDGKPIYWDSAVKTLVDPQGNALPITPKGKRVFWDPEEERFEDLNGVALTSDELLDPRITPTPETWIDTNLLLVGVLLPSYENLFYNKTTQQLQLNDGTVVAALEDGTPIHYDDDAGVVINDNTDTEIVRNDNFLGLRRGRVNIYDANSLKIRETFET